MKKDICRFIPALLIVVFLFSCVPNTAFADDIYDNFLLADHLKYVLGYVDGSVRPEEKITRSEAATLIFRLLPENHRANIWTKANKYSDVSSKSWYNIAVSTISNGNLMKGYSDGTFRGDNSITRGEFVTIVYRFSAPSYVGSDKFTDIANHWAAGYINALADSGLITGYMDGTFRPEQYITRAEAIVILNKLLGRDKISADDMLSEMKTWPDNKPGAWYYEAVQEATNSHIPAFREDGTECWTEIIADNEWNWPDNWVRE